MVQDTNSNSINGTKKRNRRSPRKRFPLLSFEDTLVLPKGILDYGLDGNINRLTLLDKMGRSPGSSITRVLISSSSRYGLTTGSYNSPTLQVTDNGSVALGAVSRSNETIEKRFELAIRQIEPFDLLYEKLKNQRLPDAAVLKDEFVQIDVDISESDSEKAVKVFTENLRFLGLVQEVSGKEYVKGFEDLLKDASGMDDTAPALSEVDSPMETTEPAETNGKAPAQPKRPALHVDIQVHIDPTSSAEQIDQIFASMARHLYGLES